MTGWLAPTLFVLLALCVATALFFFAVTRGALLVRQVGGGAGDAAAHVYPLYSNPRLMRLVDFQPIISAILLFQYHRLVSLITSRLATLDLGGREVLITSCAFGNVIPRVVDAAHAAGARRVQIADIVQNELEHVRRKLPGRDESVHYLHDNAATLPLADGAVSANVLFFLLHELPHPLKAEVLREAVRVLAPGGTLYVAEFHRPEPWVLRALGWMYFKVFEPYGLALWGSHDPLAQLESFGGLQCERHRVFFGNFQVIIATKGPAAAAQA
ncbi:MAG: class I SAM-dependent methyltransferase [Steroidobacteraceae bacterium]